MELDLADAPAAEVAVDDARLQVDHVAEFLDGQRRDLVAADGGQRARLGDVHDGLVGGDHHLLAAHGLVHQRHVERGGGVGRHLDALDELRLVADAADAHRDGPRRDAEDVVDAVEVGRGAVRGADDQDGGGDERLAVLVDHAAGELAGLGARARGRRQEGEGDERQRRETGEQGEPRGHGNHGGQSRTPGRAPRPPRIESNRGRERVPPARVT